MALTVEWFTATEVATLALPGMPTTPANVLAMADREGWRRPDYHGKRWRKRRGKGGGIEYHWHLLPEAAQLQWTLMHGAADVTAEHESAVLSPEYNELLWQHFLTLSDAFKDEAFRRFQALTKVEDLKVGGLRSNHDAVMQVGVAIGQSKNSVYDWQKLVRGQPRSSWLPLLVPQYKGRTAEAECTPEAWDALYIEYAGNSGRTFSFCYRKIKRAAANHGWAVPSESTLLRRMQRCDPRQIIFAREGEEALLRTIAPQKRDKAVFHALEAVNADGHKFDNRVQWLDGTIGRPMVVCFQDLYSGKILSHRIGKTENTNLIRLAFGDVVENFGIPLRCYLDNGRAFASKQMTGGTPNRYRGKVREDDPEGIMVRLGVAVHFTQPYSGKSKPIERGFGDFARDIARDIRLEGSYLGNSTESQPANYGEKVAPLALFKQVLEEGIREHNSRVGRRSPICASKYSFDEVFSASYEKVAIQKVTAAQKQLWLPSANNLTVRGPYGYVEFCKNQYEADFLLALLGKTVSARFDPDALHDGLHIYRSDGAYLGHARCSVAVGFDSLDAAREKSKRVADVRRRARELDAASRKLSLDEHLLLMARDNAEQEKPDPEARIVRPLFGGAALARKPDFDAEDELSPVDAAFVEHARAARAARGGHLRVIEEED